MAPEPVFRLLPDYFFEHLRIAGNDTVRCVLTWVFRHQLTFDVVIPSFHFDDVHEDDCHVIFKRHFLRPTVEPGLLVKKGCPVGILIRGRSLVTNKTGKGSDILTQGFNKVTDDLMHRGDNKAVFGSQFKEESVKVFVLQWLINRNDFVWHIQRHCGEPLPVVVMTGESHNISPLRIETVKESSVTYSESFGDLFLAHMHGLDSLDIDIADMPVESLCDLFPLLLGFLREGVAEIHLHNLTPVTDQIVDDEIQQV